MGISRKDVGGATGRRIPSVFASLSSTTAPWRRLQFEMLGKANERRQQGMIELFAELRWPRVRVVCHRDRPDAIVEVLATGTRAGVECCELLRRKEGRTPGQPRRGRRRRRLLQDDGRDRDLEARASEGIKEACRNHLGSAGEVDVAMDERPKDNAQVDRWLESFRQWLVRVRDQIVAEGGTGHFVFPDSLDVWLLEARVKHLGAGYQAELDRARDLRWLQVAHIELLDGAQGGWLVYASPGIERLADRNASDIDQLIVETVATKIGKAAKYDFDGPLWLLLRSPVLARPTPDVRRRIAELKGIDRLSEVWLLDAPANIIDPTRPPTLQTLYP